MSWNAQGVTRLKAEVLGSRSLMLETLRIRLGGEREFIKNATSGCIKQRMETELAVLKAAVAKKEAEIFDLPRRIHEAESRVLDIEASIRALREQDQAQHTNKKLEAEITRTKKKLEQLRHQKQCEKALAAMAKRAETENNVSRNSLETTGDA